MTEPARPSRLRRWLFGSAWATAGTLALAGAAAGWLFFTTAGARFVLERAAAFAGGTVEAIEGSLAGPLSAGRLSIDSPTRRVRAERVALDWSPLALLAGEVRVTRLHAASVDIATAPSKEPAKPPRSLAIPVKLVVAQVGIDRLRAGTLGDAGGGTELRDLSLKLAGGPLAWILADARAATPFGEVKAGGTLGATAPFALDAKGEIAGKRGESAWRATVEAKGPLARFEVALAGRDGGLSGTGAATVEPFAEAPLRRLVAKLEGVDLAAFAAAPRTRLAIEADLAPAGAAFLAGPVRIANAEPGPLDKERLPIASASARLAIAKGRTEATNLEIAFAGGGRARGEAAWAGGKLDAKLAVAQADLLAWHSALRATRLSGDLAATATADAQSFTVALADPRFSLDGRARIAGGRLTVERARLARGEAFAEAKGSLELAGARAFAAEGRIGKLDPAVFAKVPAGEINAAFAAKGALAGKPSGELSLDLAGSRFAGMAAEGTVAIAAKDARVSVSRADLTLGATRLLAKGALGHAGDTLELELASTDLGPAGSAFGLALGGRVALAAKVSGAWDALAGTVSLDAANLRLPGEVRVASAQARFAVGAGADAAANGRLAIRSVALRGAAKPVVEEATLAIAGTRGRHEARLEARLADGNAVRALLDGGLAAGDRLPEWRGRVEALELTGQAAFALAAPAPLLVSAGRVELGEALLGGEPGEIRLQQTRWTPAGFETRGSSSAVVVRTIQQLLGLQGAMGSNLVLVGEWDVRAGETLDGFVQLRRARGDVRVGEPRQALGLETLVLRAEAVAGRVTATADVRGKLAGQWKGEAGATVRRGDRGWEISPVAPVEGRFTVDVPDLAFLAAWIGPEARSAGRLRGEGTLAGTVREPSWSGRVEATGLAIREPSLGAEVADGTVAIALTDREARIERFRLAMPWQLGEEAARAIAAAKRPETGLVTAEGSLDLGTRKGEIRVKAAGYPLTRLPSRFLAVSGEGRAVMDGAATTLTGDFTADAGWFGIPASAPPSLSDDVIVDRGETAPAAARAAERIRLDLRVNLGEHLHFRGRGLSTRLAGSLRLAGEAGANLRATGTIRAVGGTYDAYGRTLTLERGALNFQGPVDNPGLNVLALRKGLPVEAGVEVLGTVARPKARLVSSPDVPEPEKLAWLVLGRGQGDVSAGDAATLVQAANALLGSDAPATSKILGGFGLDDVRLGRDDSSALGTLPQSTVAGRTGQASAAEVVTVGKRLTDDIYVSYRQGLADAEGSLRIAWQLTHGLQLILRAGYLPGVDAVYRFSFR